MRGTPDEVSDAIAQAIIKTARGLRPFLLGTVTGAASGSPSTAPYTPDGSSVTLTARYASGYTPANGDRVLVAIIGAKDRVIVCKLA